MRVQWIEAPPADWEADAVIFFAFENASEPLPGLARFAPAQEEWIAESVAFRDFRGKPREVAVAYGPAAARIPRVVCAGLGERASFDLGRLRETAAVALRRCRELGLSRPALPLEALSGLPSAIEDGLEETVAGALLGLYRYDELKTRDLEPPDVPETLLLLSAEPPSPTLREAAARGEAEAAGVAFTRNLVMAPGNRVTPTFLGETARALSARHGFRCEIVSFEAAKALGMGAFCAVAQGSREPACMIVIEHAPKGAESEPPLVLIGKGITFDTGGISIKPSDKMELMKHDMAGAAAVLGAFEVLGRLGSPRRVIGLCPCTENMPGGAAYKPGDVVKTLSGLTVEVISTDAEGRMVLCDALAYARRYNPRAIIDIATLTGACVVALGDRVGAVMSRDEALSQALTEIGGRVGDLLWPLPLWDHYFDDLKSDVADFKNVGDRKGGAIVAGMFLKQFVPEDIPWAHLDSAGPSWADKDFPAIPRGATGFGVRVLAQFARR